MNQFRKFDVAIIGRGITGTSAAFHLRNLGYKNNLLIGPERTPGQSASLCPGFVTAGTIDNITRIAHGHGFDLAAALLRLGMDGFRGLEKFALANHLPWNIGKLRRFAPTEHEKNEMKLAIEILQKMGFSAKISDQPTNTDPENIVGVQEDALPSATTSAEQLLDHLEHHAATPIARSMVRKITIKDSGVLVETEIETFEVEMLIAATHLNTGTLIPNLQTSLVSFADQWISFESTDAKVSLEPGDLWIGHHGHYGIWKNQQTIFMSGARFLRHWAGIEATSAEVQDNITQHLIGKGQEWFGFKNISKVTAGAILDCRPCDELPVIGPMFGQNRVLVGAGYMGAGLALGFAAGKALAEIIHSGKANDLHSGLTPARLRSLST